jgi:CubicO group peptidase (beta-lactamase class C family)
MRTTAAAALVLLLPSLASADDAAARRRAIETSLATTVAIEGVRGASLLERMKELHAPAVSYAVIENGKIVLAAAVGDADVASGRRATTSTLFQAASISKPVFAIGVMSLVERGKLSLDAPVNSMLHTWKLPENALTTATPVTLRMLLSHSGGTSVHGFPGYAIDVKRPTLDEVLLGKEPANTDPIVVDAAPDTKYNYSGGGVTIAQAAVIDQTGIAFPAFMRRTVLQPLGMTSSTYEQPLPPSRRSAAATAYNIAGREVHGKWHVYPEMAAAGLWTTPSDLARVILEVQKALAGRRANVLTTDAAQLMLTPRFPVSPTQSIGLGFFIERVGDAVYFGHDGANEGFRAIVTGSMDGSHGAVVMVNSDSGGWLLGEMVNTIAREYRWPGYNAAPLHVEALNDADAARLPGRYALPSADVVSIRRTVSRFEVLDQYRGWKPLYPIEAGKLARADKDARYALTDDGIEVIANASSPKPILFKATRLAADQTPTGTEFLAAGQIDDAIAVYREEFRKNPAAVPEASLNERGYNFFFIGRPREAVAILQLNTELYPASANTYDSLADVLMNSGDVARARAASEEELRRIDADPKATTAAKEKMRRNAQERLRAISR